MAIGPGMRIKRRDEDMGRVIEQPKLIVKSGEQRWEDAAYDLLVQQRYDEYREAIPLRHAHWREVLADEGLRRGFPRDQMPTGSACILTDEAAESSLACYRRGPDEDTGVVEHSCTYSLAYAIAYGMGMFDEVVAHENCHAYQRWVYADCDGHGDVFLWLLREWCGKKRAGPTAKWSEYSEAAAVQRAIERTRRVTILEQSSLALAQAQLVDVRGELIK